MVRTLQDVTDRGGEPRPGGGSDSILARVRHLLSAANDHRLPLPRRLDALGHAARHLDAYFMVRVGGLRHRISGGTSRPASAHLAEGRALAERCSLTFASSLLPSLRTIGIDLCRGDQTSGSQRRRLDDFFAAAVFPVITPMSVDSGRPFPHISNLSLNVAVLVRGRDRKRTRFVRVKVPRHLPRFLQLGEEALFVPVEDCVTANLRLLFPGVEVLEHHVFRVTRSLDFGVDDGAKEFLIEAPEVDWARRNSSTAVRLEVESETPDDLVQFLTRRLELDSEAVSPLPAPLDLSGSMSLIEPLPSGPEQVFDRVTPGGTRLVLS